MKNLLNLVMGIFMTISGAYFGFHCRFGFLFGLFMFSFICGLYMILAYLSENLPNSVFKGILVSIEQFGETKVLPTFCWALLVIIGLVCIVGVGAILADFVGWIVSVITVKALLIALVYLHLTRRN